MTRPGSESAPGLRAEIRVPTAARMRSLGSQLAALLRAGDLVILNGWLGAGKTTLVRGIGEGLGVRGPVTSPTFVIARIHPALRAGPDLVHVDAYRLASPAELDDLDLDADLERSVTVVEWGGGLVEELAESWLEITITMPAAGAVAGPGQAAVAAQAAACEPGPASEPAAGDELDPGDEPRTVLLSGHGDRWAAVAGSACHALSGAARVL